VLLVDNDDSFTGSLLQQLRVLGAEVACRRWHEVDVAMAGAFSLIVLSPGPGRPADRPINGALLQACAAGGVPLFGVCLGMQALGESFGGEVVAAREIVHGRTSRVHHAGRGAFAGLPSPMRATRYHSLAVARRTLPTCLEVTAWTEDGEIMGLRHRTAPIEGVQFHPESVGTPQGLALMRNVLALVEHKE
jgi:anthranilate synthase/aminodeoxychorismate synthase-like glutamine amidotransferase